MAIWTEIGKNLVKEGIFKDFSDLKEGVFERFPELIPAVGDNYWSNNHSRLLLVGESNYFKDDLELISNFKHASDWYTGDKSKLIPESKRNDVNNWKGSRGHNNIYKSMKKVLNEIGTEKFEKGLLWEAAYYNYFLRPASVTKSSKCFDKDCEEIDCQVSYLALRGIIDEIEPDIIVFVSKFAYSKFIEYYDKEKDYYGNVIVSCVNHFSHACWTQPDGQQKFENLLREYWFWGNAKCQKLRSIHSVLRQKFEVETEQECFFDEKGNYLSCIFFKVNDSSFWCQTGMRINGDDFWTCFYKDMNSKEIPALNGKGDKFTQDLSSESIIETIEKLTNQIVKEIKETA